jgi:hypothetical protein
MCVVARKPGDQTRAQERGFAHARGTKDHQKSGGSRFPHAPHIEYRRISELFLYTTIWICASWNAFLLFMCFIYSGFCILHFDNKGPLIQGDTEALFQPFASTRSGPPWMTELLARASRGVDDNEQDFTPRRP